MAMVWSLLLKFLLKTHKQFNVFRIKENGNSGAFTKSNLCEKEPLKMFERVANTLLPGYAKQETFKKMKF